MCEAVNRRPSPEQAGMKPGHRWWSS